MTPLDPDYKTKTALLGNRPTFTSVTFKHSRKIRTVIHKDAETFEEDREKACSLEGSSEKSAVPNYEMKFVQPEDFIISDSEFVPSEKEGLDPDRVLQLHQNAKHSGYSLSEYKDRMRRSLALLQNW